MTKITKEMFVKALKTRYIAGCVFYSIVVLLILFFVWREFKEALVVIYALLIVGTLLLMHINKVIKKLKNIDSLDYYIVEDIVVDYSKKLSFSHRHSDWKHTYTFNAYGKYYIRKSIYPSISIDIDKLNVSHDSIEETLQNAGVGSKFYLFVLCENGKTDIISAYYCPYYSIDENDFTLVGDKYYTNDNVNCGITVN